MNVDLVRRGESAISPRGNHHSYPSPVNVVDLQLLCRGTDAFDGETGSGPLNKEQRKVAELLADAEGGEEDLLPSAGSEVVGRVQRGVPLAGGSSERPEDPDCGQHDADEETTRPYEASKTPAQTAQGPSMEHGEIVADDDDLGLRL